MLRVAFLVLRLIFLARYAVVLGLILAGLAPFAVWGQPGLLQNLLVLNRWVQLFNVTWMSLLVATLVIVAFRIVQINARARFGLDFSARAGSFGEKKTGDPADDLGPEEGESVRPEGKRWRLRWLLWFGLGLAIPVFCAACTTLDLEPENRVLAGMLATLVILLGVGAAFFILLLLTALQQYLLHPQVEAQYLLPFESPIFQSLKKRRVNWLYGLGDILARYLDYLGPGYSQIIQEQSTGKTLKLLAPGHAQAFLWFGTALVAYAISYPLTYPANLPDEASNLPAIFFALLVLALFGALLAGMAFLLDYYHVPVVLVLLAISLISYGLHGVDHFYELDPVPQGNQPGSQVANAEPKENANWPTFKEVASQWHIPKVVPETAKIPEAKRTLVVVTAAGGGIQAAAWTTKVLAGLDEIYGDQFTRSVGFISGVSGGSVGTMYYVAGGRWTGNAPPLDDAARMEMQAASRASGLEATGWGLAYPDLVRTVFPVLTNKRIDRGWAMEQAWGRWPSRADGQRLGDVRLRQWLEPIRKGKMPVVAFNATLVETGQRLIVSPVLGPQANLDDPTSAEQFFQLYGQEANPYITTAVRLSATFPYVSPICRPLQRNATSDPNNNYHVADGGYTDNEGMATVINWIGALLLHYADDPSAKPFDRILVIRIMPFPLLKPDPAKANAGWLDALLGPAEAILKVRTASQAERNRTALEMLMRIAVAEAAPGQRPHDELRTLARGRDIARAKARWSRTKAAIEAKSRNMQEPEAKSMEKHQLEVGKYEQDVEQFNQELVDRAPITWTAFICQAKHAPLSWKLSETQKKDIDRAWEKIKSNDLSIVPPGLKEPPLETLGHFFSKR